MSFESDSNNDTFYSASSTTPIMDTNEDIELDSFNNSVESESFRSLTNSTFLIHYARQIRNLLCYYEYRKIIGTEEINSTFFQTSFAILRFIKKNLNKMDKFINDYVDQYKMDKDRIFNLWKSLKKFLLNDFNIQNIQNININNENNLKQLDEDFYKFLMCLINENVAKANGIEYFNYERISENENKVFRSRKEFARAFIIFILDMPAYVIVLDEEHPFVELKIYLVEIQWLYCDNDVMYTFSYKRCKSISFSSSNYSEAASNEYRNESDLPNPNDPNIPSTSSPETTNYIKESLDVPKFASSEDIINVDELLKPKNVELEESKEFCIIETLSTNHNFHKYYSTIRLRFNLNHKTTLKFLDSVKVKKSSIWVMMFQILHSFSSILDMILSLLLVYTFHQSNQLIFSFLTMAVIIITGIINILFERNFSENFNQPNYLLNSIIKGPVRYIISFFLQSSFLSRLRLAIVSIKEAKEEEIVTLLKHLCGHSNADFHYTNQILKYLETYLEVLPQTILQLYISLTTKQCGWLQLMSIVNGAANIQFTILAFEALTKHIHIIDVWKYPSIILTTFSYIGFLIISHSLIFWQFHWIFGILRISVHVLISYFSKWDKHGTLIFLNCKLKQIKYDNFFNYITAFDYTITLCSCMLRRDQLKDSVFVALFVCQVIFFIIWMMAIFQARIIFCTNVMHIADFVKKI